MKQIIVIGCGLPGIMSAAWLARHLPRASHRITFLTSGDSADSQPEFCEAGPDLQAYNQTLKISDADFMQSAGGLPILGHYYGGDDAHLRPFGGYGQLMGGAGFHHVLRRAGRPIGLSGLADYSAAASLIKAGKFAPGSEFKEGLLSTFDTGYTFSPGAYAARLEKAATGFGAIITPVKTYDIARSETGRAVSINGHAFDLLVDTRSAEDSGLRLWDCVPGLIETASETPAGAPAQMAAVQIKAGVQTVPLLHSQMTITSKPSGDHKFGAAHTFWDDNIVRIGRAAARLPAVAGFGTRMVIADLARLTALMPAQFHAPIEAREYNRQTGPIYERLRDYLALHFALGTDGFSPGSLPQTAAAKYTLFAARGRFPVFDDEHFLRFDLINLFMGKNIIPRDYDVMAHSLTPAQIEAQLAGLKSAIAQFVAKAPLYSDLVRRAAQRRAA